MWIRRALAVLPVLCGSACEANGGAAGVETGGRTTGGSGALAGRDVGGEAGSGAAGGTSADASGLGGVGGDGSAGRAGGGVSGGGASSGGLPGAGLAGANGGGAGGGGKAGGGGAAPSGGVSNSTPVSLTIFGEVVFYDGYAQVVREAVPAGALRLRNDLFTHKLSDQELSAIQSTLRVRVNIGALCDNYDRIGSVALALVAKGRSTYVPEDVERIEIGRYITPFMDRNRQPDEVSYAFTANNLVPVLKDADLRKELDLWLELELFGVPYAANDEVAGCANRSDVFRGTVIFDSDSSAPAPAFDELLPLAYKVPFNNYQQGASDRSGTTRKTLEFAIDAATADTQLVLITSNHGANSGGEEYVRRDHFVYVDGERKLQYKPGRTSCEPFRKFNTQANGIYGPSPRSDGEWQSFSNWCPGDRIDTRIIPLGPLSAGSHEFVIDVPDAEFGGGDGNFPLSLYLQSRSH